MTSKHLFLTILEAEKAEIKVHQTRCLVRTHSLIHRLHLFTVSSSDGSSEASLLRPFYKGTNLNLEGSTLTT